MNNSILIISDLHLGRFGYSEYIKDERISEKKEIFDFIIEQSKDCEQIVFLGDIFNTKNPLSETVKEFTSFLERFENKEVFMISGNHCLKATGETAIDYLKEISNKKWHIITGKPQKIGDYVFAPYLTKNLLECENNTEAKNKLMELLPSGKILFHHFSMTGTKTSSGMSTDFFDEIVLDYKELSKKYDYLFGGHIHQTNIITNNIIVPGSIFHNEIGEDKDKFIFKITIGEDGEEINKITLPGRKIYKLENPTIQTLEKIEKGNIIKIVLTEKKTAEEIETLKKKANKFDAFILVENIAKERKKMHIDSNRKITDFSIENLLELYSKERNIDLEKIKKGFSLIRK